MRTYVITGGTRGIGRAVAMDRLRSGHRVAVIGRGGAAAKAFLAEAERLGAGERAHFITADLSLVAETKTVIERIRETFDRVDAIVLCARYIRSERHLTEEGFEHSFALYYLSRFLFSHRMIDLLDAAEAPVIVNVSGPGSGTDQIRWDDLGHQRDYDTRQVLAQGGQLNDLLALAFTRRRRSPKVRYVLLHPGVVATSFAGDYDDGTAAAIDGLRAAAQPVEAAVAPILEVLDHPPAEPLTAISHGNRLDTGMFDTDLAERLYTETTRMLGALASARPGVSPTNLRRLLDTPVFGTVATLSPDGRPHQSVVWIKRDGDDVLFTVATGSRKERNLRRDPRVSVLVSPPDEPYAYAAIEGVATLSANGGAQLRDELAVKYTGTTYAEHNPEAAQRHGDIPLTVVRVTPTKVTGRL